MHIVLRCRALMALICLSIVACAVYPLAAAAQTTPGSVLFSRTVFGTVNGLDVPISSATFIIGDDGLHERTLTPYSTGH